MKELQGRRTNNIMEGKELYACEIQRVYDLGRRDFQGIWVMDPQNLKSINLECSNLQMAHMRGANLESANLYGCDLRGASFRGANLEDAELRSTNCYKADFSETNTEKAWVDHTTKYLETWWPVIR
jgi:uncharacterized protein YjbI with pentapeptide repeats